MIDITRVFRIRIDLRNYKQYYLLFDINPSDLHKSIDFLIKQNTN